MLVVLAPAGLFSNKTVLSAERQSTNAADIPAPQAQPSDSQAEERPARKQLNATGDWENRYTELDEHIKIGKASRKDADRFYEELSTALTSLRKQLREAMQQWAPAAKTETGDPADKTPPKPPGSIPRKAEEPERAAEISIEEIESAEALKSALLQLYGIRIRLLHDVTPALRDRVTGTGLEGVREIGGELDYIALRFEFNARSAGYVGTRILRDYIRAPLPLVGSMVILVLAVVVFRWWRKWAKEGVPGIRQRLLSGTERNRTKIHMARFMWYFERARLPVEWLVLLGVLFGMANVREIQVVGDLVWTTLKWILFAWLAVRLIDAFAARNTGFKTKSAHLRLRSIWMVTAWLLILGLGLSLTHELAGKATLYAWIWMLFKILALPLAAMLVYWWREEIFSQLAEDNLVPNWIEKMLRQKKGVKSLVSAAMGALFLGFNQFRLWVIRGISAFAGGRLLLTNLVQLEAGRNRYKIGAGDATEPIPGDLRNRLIRGNGRRVDSVEAETLDFLDDRMTWPNGGTIIITAERGGGKSELFKRLKAKSRSTVLLIDCPPGGIDALTASFCASLGMDGSCNLAETLSRELEARNIRTVGIDNLHRLGRPCLGGQEDLDRFYRLTRQLPQKLLWIFGVDRAAWQYISRARANRTFLERLIELNLWSEEQIAELIEIRCAEANIRPDFSKLVIPHQFDGSEYDTMEERNRHGVYRILWNASEGNPAVAMGLWADSLAVSTDGAVSVCFPDPPSTKELENISLTCLLVLRVIIESELANRREILESLRLPEGEVAGALRFAQSRGWVEEIDGRCRLTWRWFRSVTRVLSRQNLLARRTLGGD